MSSDLYTVAVDSVAGPVALLEVTIVHPDIFVFPTSSYDMGAADRCTR